MHEAVGRPALRVRGPPARRDQGPQAGAARGRLTPSPVGPAQERAPADRQGTGDRRGHPGRGDRASDPGVRSRRRGREPRRPRLGGPAQPSPAGLRHPPAGPAHPRPPARRHPRRGRLGSRPAWSPRVAGTCPPAGPVRPRRRLLPDHACPSRPATTGTPTSSTPWSRSLDARLVRVVGIDVGLLVLPHRSARSRPRDRAGSCAAEIDRAAGADRRSGSPRVGPILFNAYIIWVHTLSAAVRRPRPAGRRARHPHEGRTLGRCGSRSAPRWQAGCCSARSRSCFGLAVARGGGPRALAHDGTVHVDGRPRPPGRDRRRGHALPNGWWISRIVDGQAPRDLYDAAARPAGRRVIAGRFEGAWRAALRGSGAELGRGRACCCRWPWCSPRSSSSTTGARPRGGPSWRSPVSAVVLLLAWATAPPAMVSGLVPAAPALAIGVVLVAVDPFALGRLGAGRTDRALRRRRPAPRSTRTAAASSGAAGSSARSSCRWRSSPRAAGVASSTPVRWRPAAHGRRAGAAGRGGRPRAGGRGRSRTGPRWSPSTPRWPATRRR